MYCEITLANKRLQFLSEIRSLLIGPEVDPEDMIHLLRARDVDDGANARHLELVDLAESLMASHLTLQDLVARGGEDAVDVAEEGDPAWARQIVAGADTDDGVAVFVEDAEGIDGDGFGDVAAGNDLDEKVDQAG